VTEQLAHYKAPCAGWIGRRDRRDVSVGVGSCGSWLDVDRSEVAINIKPEQGGLHDQAAELDRQAGTGSGGLGEMDVRRSEARPRGARIWSWINGNCWTGKAECGILTVTDLESGVPIRSIVVRTGKHARNSSSALRLRNIPHGAARIRRRIMRFVFREACGSEWCLAAIYFGLRVILSDQKDLQAYRYEKQKEGRQPMQFDTFLCRVPALPRS